jgi:SAM-dependent methyltransferase/uncharacterized protein YbaR (Trm112 family)
MHELLLDILACPGCSLPLQLSGTKRGVGDGRILEGLLQCDGCGGSYMIENGIPRLRLTAKGPPRLDAQAEATSAHFTHEFSALAEQDRDMVAEDLLEFYFVSRTGIDPKLPSELAKDPYPTSAPSGYSPDVSWLAGRRVLDAGCGSGRFTKVAGNGGAGLVVGLDIGSLDRAASYCKMLSNVHFVEGSVLSPPFMPGVFDYVFSLGVLHHTSNPQLGCEKLARLLREDGLMSVWVYPHEYWGGFPRAWVGRLLHRILCRLPPQRGFSICERYLYRLGRLQSVLAQRSVTKLLTAPLFLISIPRHEEREVMVATIFDYYCPPTVSTHTFEEVEGWLRGAGFSELTRLPVPTSWLARKGNP